MVRPVSGAGRVAARDEFRVLPAERREGDDAGVEPDVADLDDAPDRLAARLARDRHLVDPRAAQLLELVESAGRALLELGLRADHVQVAAVAGVEGQRQAVVTAPRDVPVAHVAEPVVHALAHVAGRPLDLLVRREQLRPELVDRDQPVVRDAPDQRRVAAPAVRIAMLVRLGRDERPALGEPADDLIGGLDGREPVQPTVGVVEPARLVDRHQHRQLVDPAELEVLLPSAGRDVDDSRPLLERDLVPRDHTVRDLTPGTELVERRRVPPADELLAPLPLEEGLLRMARDGEPLAALATPVLGIRLHGGGDVGRQRPRRRRPDHERLVRPVEEGEADEERRVGPVLVDARL